MNTETHNQLANFIWSICNLLRGPYKRNEYRKVILPLTVLRRFDCLLAPTKTQALATFKEFKGKPESIIRSKMGAATGYPFYNLSKLEFAPSQKDRNSLLDDPSNLAPNLNSYINGFSPNVRAIMERFGFDQQIAKMADKNLLFNVIKEFTKIDLSFDRVDSMQMGYVFEELIRIGAEQSNEEAGEHFTPREVIKLMVNLLLSPEQDLRRSHVVKTIYDPACGTGGMLSVVRKQLGGRAKAMVVTSSRIQAVRYKLAFERYLTENGYTDIKPLVAFSGTVKDPDTGVEYTEPGMNPDVVTGKPIPESQLPERFASGDYQVLLVANKYQTGFDQPLLAAMYVDKRLDGVQAVQTLSRLNRKTPGKEEPFVLDFVNKPEDIYAAFKPYFDSTSLQESANPEMLASLKHELDQMQVYHWSEVEAYARIFYRMPDRQNPADHAHMQRHLQPAVDRFKAIEDDQVRSSFRDKLGGYVRMYSFLSQILPYGDPDLEMLYSYGRFLLPHLPQDRETTVVKIGDEVELQYYRLQRVSSGAIDLKVGEPEGVYSPTDVGTGKTKEEKAPLSEIIQVLNERFGTAFTEEDRLFFDQIKTRAVNNAQVIQTAMANPLDKFQLGVRKLVEDLMIQRMGENDKIVTRYMDDGEFQRTAFPILAREIFEAIHAETAKSS